MANIGEVVTILTKSIPFRREFNLAMKQSKETPHQWLARVKTLAELCSFGQCQYHCILDKFLTGFDTEIINHLCSTAEYLDIATALEITEAYSKRKICDVTETIHMHDEKGDAQQRALEFVDQAKPVISEILMIKCEEILDDDGYDEFQVGDDFFVDNGADNRHTSGNSSDDDGANDSKDSDFHPSDYEGGYSNRKKKSSKKVAISSTTEQTIPRVKRKYVKKPKGETKNGITGRNVKQTMKAENSDEIQENARTETTNTADITAPKKKRNYKQRPIKEKETFECDICHYKVNHKCHLARHMLIHLNQKSFICHECGKGFNLFINLNAHLRRHAGYKPHVCEVCKASFLDKTRLKLHIRTHTGERPYGCTICEKRFADRYYMKIHMRLHTGEKPFKCDQCQRSFSQSSSLSLHKKKSCTLYC